jgi:asparagine synthase (glutamine-hydrolysing)
MCGIVARIQNTQSIDERSFARQVDTLSHRGPDDRGIWLNENRLVALGSRRLAIQDLSEAGHMPMSDSSKKVWVAFNGEIYNFKSLRKKLIEQGYKFCGASDTEVLLAAYLEWGTECLDLLNGMFGFAIFDSRENISQKGRLFIARDRAGEKSLYYWHHDSGFSCASELKALMSDSSLSRKLDPMSVDIFLGLGYVPGDMCILKDVKKLRPANAATYDFATNTLDIWQYWSAPAPQAQQNPQMNLLCDELKDLLFESVHERLVADVPVGILLSGGVDSSLVTAAAAAVSSNPVKTFTIIFPGCGHYDESKYAASVAKWFGTEHHKLSVESDFVDLLPDLAHQYDEPLADSSLIPTYIVSKLTKQYVTVALGGDGGDELFGGYPTYCLALQKQKLFRVLPKHLRKAISSAARILPFGTRGKKHLLGLHGDLKEAFIGYSILFDRDARRNLLHTDICRSIPADIDNPYLYRARLWMQTTNDPVRQMTQLDFSSYLPDDILVKVDRASMAVALEVRAPFLDRRIIEFAFRNVPSHLKVNSRFKKILLRSLCRRLLPPDMNIERKQGFSLPPSFWSDRRFISLCNEVFSTTNGNILNKNTIRQIAHATGALPALTKYLFPLLMLQLWQDYYRVTV